MQIENEELQYFTNRLSEWETAIQRSIQFELLKIDRIVYAHELEYIPFHEEVAPFIEAITLDTGQLPLVLTSFRDSTEKYLSDFISQNEIDHWDMIALLRLLKTVGVSADKKSNGIATKNRRLFYAAIFSFSNSISSICLGVL